MRLTFVFSSTIALLTAACSAGGGLSNNPPTTFSNGSGSSPSAGPTAQVRTSNQERRGPEESVVLYTLSNEATHNSILEFASRHGGLQHDQSFDTHGLGDPSIAGAVAGSIAISDDRRFLFAVDAGSNEISSFRVASDGLHYVGKIAAGGMEPISLAVHRDLLFVLDEASSSIAGFRIGSNGALHSIPNSNAPLSGSNVGPAQISFDTSGRVLVVTEKNTNNIDTYSVANGIPTGPTVHASSGKTPFGFAFVPHSEIMVVSEAFGGAMGAGAASSYSVTPPDMLTTISKSIPDDNTAPCWVVITRGGGLAFTSNTGNATISAYSIDSMGDLTLTTQNGVSAQTGQSPTDLALGPGDQALFVINLKSGTIGAYAVGSGGTLTQLRGAKGLPASALGLAALPLENS